jgi:predicted ATPase
MEHSYSFGYWVMRWRKARNLTQEALADLVGCSLSTIRKIETDERRPSQQIAELLVLRLVIPPDEQAAFLASARGEHAPDRLHAPQQSIVSPPDQKSTKSQTLPPTLTVLIGRNDEVQSASALLQQPRLRLLTLSGPGGVGKTRLSLQIAEELEGSFANGVCFVDLAPIKEPGLVGATIAAALGVTETGGQPVLEQVKHYVRERQLLLLLDNFEQVLAAGPLVIELLAAAPRLKVIVTSRAALRVSGEHEFVVPPLEAPDPLQLPPRDRLLEIPAVALFVERARTVRPQLQITPTNALAVAAICSRVDGLPLAIELAAARSKLFAPQELLARLDKRLSMLVGGPRDLPIRQRTLRDTLAWSYDLLTLAERQLFGRMAVFAGSADLLAIETICGDATAATEPSTFELVEALLDKSLLRQIEGVDSETRFMMLETIREYALERFESSGEAELLRQQHAEHYLALAEHTAPELTSPQQEIWLDRLEREYDNLREALAWALGAAQIAVAARICAALWRFWLVRGRWSEGRQWLESVLPALATLPASIQSHVLHGASVLAVNQNDYARAKPLSEAALIRQREIGDQRGIALSLTVLAWVCTDQGDHAQALIYYEECLNIHRLLGDQQGVAIVLNNLGNIAQSEGDYVRAHRLFGESLVLYRAQADQLGLARVGNNLGLNAYYQGDYKQGDRPLYAKPGAVPAAGRPIWHGKYTEQHGPGCIYTA